MQLTLEQQAIVEHITTTDGLLKISAIAGSGKTTLLTAIAKSLPSGSGLYLAYNKSVATEAKAKFPSWVSCSTTHSLAYQTVFKPFKLKLGDFSYRAITHPLAFEVKCNIVDHIESFCLSKYTDFNDYGKDLDFSLKFIEHCTYYLGQMSTGKVACTHSFYLKFFHILLAKGNVTFPQFDVVMLDEAGDLNEVTLEIFKLLPAPKKILVGDPYQNIYTFNGTINCFKVLKDVGVYMPMSQSFRVSSTIATKVEKFCQTYLDPDMQFKGVPITDDTITSKLYIARTNSSLINKMMELNSLNIPYGLVRSAKQIFNLHLILISLKPRGFVASPEFKYLQDDVDTFYSDRELQLEYKTHLNYIKEMHSYDLNLVSAIKSIFKYSSRVLIQCFEEAKKHEKLNQSYMLGTCHSCKGLTNH